jgi:predicted alpha/beta hydrolase family esterase
MRLCALLWPFPFGVRLGWATTRVPNPPLERALGRAYLLRGQGAVFSRGFGRLCDRLRQANVWAEDLRCVGDRWVRRHLAADRRANRLRGPLILIGHSCGGRYALFTARQLEARGVEVDLLVCLDVVAWPFRVAGNVRRAIHLYRSRRRLYPARPLLAAPGSEALIENVDLDAPDSPLRERWLHHLNITARASVQDWVFGRVTEALGKHPLTGHNHAASAPAPHR